LTFSEQQYAKQQMLEIWEPYHLAMPMPSDNLLYLCGLWACLWAPCWWHLIF